MCEDLLIATQGTALCTHRIRMVERKCADSCTKGPCTVHTQTHWTLASVTDLLDMCTCEQNVRKKKGHGKKGTYLTRAPVHKNKRKKLTQAVENHSPH
jgi:hypothetical protein